MKAFAKNVRISPRKARLVADLIKLKPAKQALEILDCVNKKAASIIRSVLYSAISNAKNKNQYFEDLSVRICVDKGIVMKRIKPISRGRRHIILKRTSHITAKLFKNEN